jgi:hypothetical protein
VQKLSLRAARRLAVRATRLDRPQPTSILEVARTSGPLQLDPTASVARSEQLVLWSRLGRYDTAELDRLLWEERELFTWRAFLYPAADWPLVAAAGKSFPGPRYGNVQAWLDDNKAFERYVLSTLRRRGATRQSELEDRSSRPWVSTGWTHGKNVSQLLEFLWARGKVLVAGRAGQERIWDLAERVVPPAKAPAAAAAARIELERVFLRNGPMTAGGFKRVPALWLLPLADAFEPLVADGVLKPFEIDGVRGTWYAHRDLLEDTRPFRGRTTFLSPFDPLVYDRRRAVELWGFAYRLEIYVPKAKREYGYYVLPILAGDRLAGRIEPVFDRKENVLRVEGVWWEDGPVPIEKPLRELARWLGARDVTLP